MKRLSFESLQHLKRSSGGLSLQEVRSQKARFGDNAIIEVTSNRWLEILKETIHDPMIWFLMGAGLIFIFLDQKNEAITLFIAILPLSLMDAFLHWRTQSSTLILKSNLSSTATVLREGAEHIIDSRDLVPGDLALVSTGAFIPADGVMEEAHEIQVDESVLTGEAYPVQKLKCLFDPFDRITLSTSLVPLENFVFAGTRVLTGHGSVRILFTGMNTAYGEIVQSVSQMPHERTPLQIAIGNLVRNLIYISAGFCVLLAGVRIYQGHGWLDALLSAATLAIAAIPEEFPVVFTFFLGVGIYRLAQRHALVRRAVSVENIGRVTQICTDKTGTITTGELKLAHLDPAALVSEEALLTASAIASNSEGSDPVDIAIFKKAISIKSNVEKAHRRFPFTEDRKRESAFIRHGEGYLATTKGSPEAILELTNLSDQEKIIWLEKTFQWAKEGHKVLATAQRGLTAPELETNEEPKAGYDFMGLLVFEDPPRLEVAMAVRYAYDNNIKVLMLTGDHPETAAAVAKEVGLGRGLPKILSAETEAFKLEDKYLREHKNFLQSLDVVARCTPLQKLKIVNSLKAENEIVAVTGDGVNDVPALKAANIGIAMGERGTKSAKEVSSIILGDDNFKTIVSAIMEGRQLFANLKISFEYLLLIHIPFVLTAAFVPLFGYPLVYLPVHIVWLELIIHPTAILAFQASASSNVRVAQQHFFDRVSILRLATVGIGMAILIGIYFKSGIQESDDIGHARANVMAILSVWSISLVIYFTGLKTRVSQVVAGATLLTMIIFIRSNPMSQYLHVSLLHQNDWFNVGVVVSVFIFALMGYDFILKKSKTPAA